MDLVEVRIPQPGKEAPSEGRVRYLQAGSVPVSLQLCITQSSHDIKASANAFQKQHNQGPELILLPQLFIHNASAQHLRIGECQ
jgi:hypothetical protein